MRVLIMAGHQLVYDIVLHMQCHFLSVLIRIHVIHPKFQTPQLVQLMRPPLGGLGATYDDHLRLIGKLVVDFLLTLIELFC